MNHPATVVGPDRRSWEVGNRRVGGAEAFGYFWR